MTGEKYEEQGISTDEAYALVDKLRAIGSHSVLITSCIVDGQHAVVGFNQLTDEHFLLPYEEIPVQFPGTGDIFSSLIVGRLKDGDNLRHATRLAMDTLRNWIDINKDNDDINRGIPVEKHLADLSF
nr:bifunctional hydroxymethylpyrimidine kinase/phosphomethylpyrimidine kinase [uncultured Prevotella sp.]